MRAYIVLIYEPFHNYRLDVVRHTCDPPLYINPNHLVDGTYLDNIKDKVFRGRTHNHTPQELYEKVLSLRKKGLTYRRIAGIVGRKYKTI